MSYGVRIKMPPDMNPFSLPRKADRWRGDIRYKHERTIYKIEPIGKRSGRCFSVDSPNRCFIAGKNYVVTHNSTTAICKTIELAINKSLWPKFWPGLVDGQRPAQFWYLYPSRDVADIEATSKWVEYLPRQKDHPEVGWKLVKDKSKAHSIVFNSGVSVYFKTYEQDAQNLQTGTVYWMVCDEEPDVRLVPELQMRVNATNGYIAFVFTATKGQSFFREVIEDRKRWQNEARIWQVSLWDCMKYANGTPSQWTKERIQATENKCISQAEIDRRVRGRFVKDEGLEYPTFQRIKHVKPYANDFAEWDLFSGVDYGSTGPKNHRAAIVVVALSPDRTRLKGVRIWRAPRPIVTTQQDIVNEYVKIQSGLHKKIDYGHYDFAAKDFGTIAGQMGLAMTPADKARESGRAMINTLLKMNAIEFYEPSDVSRAASIPDDYLQAYSIAEEFETMPILESITKKVHVEDDAVDAFRYAISKAPIDYNRINSGIVDSSGEGVKFSGESRTYKEYTVDDERKLGAQLVRDGRREQMQTTEQELSEWDSMLNPY
jgi:phage terminase large subunit-like protein